MTTKKGKGKKVKAEETKPKRPRTPPEGGYDESFIEVPGVDEPVKIYRAYFRDQEKNCADMKAVRAWLKEKRIAARKGSIKPESVVKAFDRLVVFTERFYGAEKVAQTFTGLFSALRAEYSKLSDIDTDATNPLE